MDEVVVVGVEVDEVEADGAGDVESDERDADVDACISRSRSPSVLSVDGMDRRDESLFLHFPSVRFAISVSFASKFHLPLRPMYPLWFLLLAGPYPSKRDRD